MMSISRSRDVMSGASRHLIFVVGIIAVIAMVITAAYFVLNMPYLIEEEMETSVLSDYDSGLGGAFYAFCIAIVLVFAASVVCFNLGAEQPKDRSSPGHPGGMG